MIEGILAGVLERNRERINALVRTAASGPGSMEPRDLSPILTDVVAPVTDAVQAIDPAMTERCAMALIELSIDMLRQKLLGSSAAGPQIFEAWRKLLPLLGRALRHDARKVAGSIANAVLAIEAQRRPPQESAGPHAEGGAKFWVDRMSAAAAYLTDAETLLRAGRVAAWRSGLAQYRVAALHECETLDPALSAILLAMDPSVLDHTLDGLRKDPWFDPASTPGAHATIRSRIGSFRGFGGEFLRPPRVSMDRDAVIVYEPSASGAVARHWRLFADRFGTTLVPLRTGVSVGPAVPLPTSALAGLENLEPTSLVRTGAVVALTVRHSHAVYVVSPAP